MRTDAGTAEVRRAENGRGHTGLGFSLCAAPPSYDVSRFRRGREGVI